MGLPREVIDARNAFIDSYNNLRTRTEELFKIADVLAANDVKLNEQMQMAVVGLAVQNAILKNKTTNLEERLVEVSKSLNQLTHLYAKQEAVNAELHARIHELQTHCSGSDGGFHNDME